MSQGYSFLDVVALEPVRARFGAGDALFILSRSLDALIWANGAGAEMLGFADIDAALDAPQPLSETVLRQVRSVPGFPEIAANVAVALRLRGATLQPPARFTLTSLKMPDGEDAFLFAARLASDAALSPDDAKRAVSGFADPSQRMALIDGEGRILAAANDFDRLGLETAGLTALAKVDGPRITRLRVRVGSQQAPAGAVRLSEDPPLALVIVVADDLPEANALAAETSAPERAHQEGPPDIASERDVPPMRFVWRTDTEGRFSALSPEFAALLGETEAAYLGQSFRAVAQRLDFDAEGEIAGLLERRDTWSGRSVLWPNAAGDRVVPVDLAALPVYDRDRRFEGFRGFGMARIAEASLREPIFTEPAPGKDAGPVSDDAPPAAVGDSPAPADTEPVERGTVVQLRAERLQAVERPALSSGERNAFREIGDRLRAANVVPMPQRDPPVRPAPEIAEQISHKAGTEEETTAPIIADEAADDDARLAIEGGAPRRAKDRSLTGRRSPMEAIEFGEDEKDETASAVKTPADQTVDDTDALDVDGEGVLEKAALGSGVGLSEPDLSFDRAEDDWFALPDDEPFGFASEPADVPAEVADKEAVAQEAEDVFVEPTKDFDVDADLNEADSDPEEIEPEQTEPQPVASHVSFEGSDDSAALLETLPLAILVHAGDALQFANREFAALTGYEHLRDLEAAGGIDALLFPHEGDEADLMMLRRADGSELPVHAHLQSIPWGKGKTLMLSLRATQAPAEPATDTQLLLDEARSLLEELRAIVDTATDGVVLITPEGTIRMLSRPAEALFGQDAADVAGKPFASLFAIESHRTIRDYLNGLVDHGVASVLNDGREVIGREAHGRFIPLFMTIGRLPADSGFCAVVRDITSWKRAEEELSQARFNAERTSSQKSEFLARVSHEIRTPLNAIIGFSELMMDERFGPIGNDRYRDYLRDINRSGNHVLDLVNDLLDISKIEAGEQELSYVAVSLNDTLSEAVAMMQPQANRERVIIRSSFASKVPEVVADLRSIRQIALNLLSNAVRYTQAGGQVVVSTSYENSGVVVMRVRDTGVGMSSAELDQALKPFKQIHALKRGQHDGTGLGLPLTKAMVEANRARFAIQSSPGEGTLVEVTFPSTRVLAD